MTEKKDGRAGRKMPREAYDDRRTFDPDKAKNLVENTALTIKDMAAVLECNYHAVAQWYGRNYSKAYREERKQRDPLYGLELKNEQH